MLLAGAMFAIAACATAPSDTRTAAPAGAIPPLDPRLDGAKSAIKTLVDDGTLVSAAIGVIKNGDIIWAEAFGDADRESGKPADIHSAYGIASMGKAITATAVMTLVDANELDLDTDISQLLGPDSVRVYAGDRAPTVRELLNMTAGVPHGALTYFGGTPPTGDAVLDAQSFVAFAPGTVFHYSNFSVALAERVIEKASGAKFDDYLAEAIFKPLGMTDATIGADAPTTVARYGANSSRFDPLTPYPRSSRQISASLSDLLKFAAAQLRTPLSGQDAILSSASLDAMQNERSGVAGAHLALGIANFDLGDGRRWLISSGNDMGVQSSMTLLPEAKLGVVFITNSSGYQADEIGLMVADALAPGFLAEAVGVINAFEGRTTPFQPAADWTGRWSGAIESARGNIPVSIAINSEGGVDIFYDGAPPQPAGELAVRDGMLTGVFEGELPLIEAPESPHRIEFSLVMDAAAPDAGRLAGFVLANFRTARGKFEIPAPISLHRTAD
jgi:CubicO group peptidase (beta-lactamase class C family)